MFKLPQEVKRDLANFKNSLQELLEKKITPSRFKGIRVPWGIYSHRGGEVFMTRIRIPAGIVTPAQLKALAFAANKYGSGRLHITTRQDIQIHDVKIENTIKVMDYLKEFELSPRGGGGNTLRNIIACPFAGLCKDEVFDVRGNAIGLSEYLLKQDTSFTLPRKFKISFSGCSHDCAGVLVNDIGLLAQKKNEKKGFKVFVGGGMGADSRVGTLLEEFLPEEDLGYCVAAVKNVFYRKGNRKNKHHNRLRFLIYDDLGFEQFKKIYKEEYRELKEKEYIALRNVEFSSGDEEKQEIPDVKDKEYNEFLNYNITPQKQRGFSIVTLRIPRGDLEWQKLVSLAELEKDFKGIQFASTQNQNLAITWVKNKDLHRLFLKLKEILEDFLYPETLLDVVACKGASTCNLGLCDSPNLAEVLEEMIKKEFLAKKIFKKVTIKINGCPNACGQHPIGNIALNGLVRKVDNRPVPFYKLLLGGRKDAEKTKLAQESGIIPGRNVPAFLKDFLRKAYEELKENEDIYKFLDEKGQNLAAGIIKKYSYVPSYSEDKSFYIDWGKTEEFSLDGLGPGECGAGVLDMIDSDLTEAKIALESAEKKDFLTDEIKRALFLSARALLIVKGYDPKTALEAFELFKEKFIAEGFASEKFTDIKDIFESIKDDLSLKARKEKFLYAKDFLGQINSVYKNMDSSFNFPQIKREEVKKEQPEALSEQKEKDLKLNFLDLKGTPCPINYVKAKLVMENLNPGDMLELVLDEGEPMDNVPRSLKDDGHEIVKIEKLNGTYKVLVKKS